MSISRAEQDEFAINSYKKTTNAVEVSACCFHMYDSFHDILTSFVISVYYKRETDELFKNIKSCLI